MDARIMNDFPIFSLLQYIMVVTVSTIAVVLSCLYLHENR